MFEPEKIVGLPLPEVRKLLASKGYPSDLVTASRVRKAAQDRKLFWTTRGLSVDGEALVPAQRG